jgi:hypothetical protein
MDSWSRYDHFIVPAVRMSSELGFDKCLQLD